MLPCLGIAALERQQDAFERQQSLLGLDAGAAAIADESAVGADDAMAGDDDRDRIAPTGGADRACRTAERRGYFAVAAGAAVWNFQHRLPHKLVERGPLGRQRQIEFGQPTV